MKINSIVKFTKIKLLSNVGYQRNIVSLKSLYLDYFTLNEILRTIGRGILDNSSLIREKKILIKPNWVLHNQTSEDELCLRTHDSIILVLLEILMEQKPSSIIIGDAPIQGCAWHKMLSNDFLDKVNGLSDKFKVPVAIKDFRRVTFDPKLNKKEEARNPLSDYIIFDLGKESYLEEISTDESIFRVTDYAPERLAKAHRKGVHKYCISKELFKADLILSLPKVKTHQKTGITCALKNLVGLNGDKDFLPHHRIGGTSFGGDCYPGGNILRLWSEYLLDMANRRQETWTYKLFKTASTICWRLTNPQNVHHLAAAWYGNDTTWRMVLDLNKIAVYGKADGSISNKPQRVLYSLCDGIIGGQGNGPLEPEPLPLGIISLTNDSLINDICMATLMGFNYKKIPLLARPSKIIDWKNTKIFMDNQLIELEELKEYSIKTLPPNGWLGYLK